MSYRHKRQAIIVQIWLDFGSHSSYGFVSGTKKSTKMLDPKRIGSDVAEYAGIDHMLNAHPA